MDEIQRIDASWKSSTEAIASQCPQLLPLEGFSDKSFVYDRGRRQPIIVLLKLPMPLQRRLRRNGQLLHSIIAAQPSSRSDSMQ